MRTPNVRHGTVGCYAYHRCRCQDCRRANAGYMRGLRRVKKRLAAYWAPFTALETADAR